MIARLLDLPQLPQAHIPPPHHKLTDGPRLMACLRQLRSSSASASSSGSGSGSAASSSAAAATAAFDVRAVHTASSLPHPAAYLLIEEANHAGPRFGMVTVTEDSGSGSGSSGSGSGSGSDPDGAANEAARAARRALEEVARLQLASLRFFGLPEVAVAAADAVLPPRGYARRSHNPCAQYVLRGALPPHAERACGDAARRLEAAGYRFDRLRADDAPLVDSLWPYRSNWSLAFIRERVIGGGLATACARDAASGAPVAWAVEYEDGSFGMLTTLEAHRRKGLARAVLGALCRALIAAGAQRDEAAAAAAGGGGGGCSAAALFCYVVVDNTPSRSLLESMGFEATGVFAWQHWERVGDGGRGGGGGAV